MYIENTDLIIQTNIHLITQSLKTEPELFARVKRMRKFVNSASEQKRYGTIYILAKLSDLQYLILNVLDVTSTY
jgi:hypothetical protein